MEYERSVLKSKLFFGFLFVSISFSNLCIAMEEDDFTDPGGSKHLYSVMEARCEAFNAVHLNLSYADSSDDIPFCTAFRKIGQLMSAEERQMLNDGKYPNALGPMTEVYSSVWENADASHPITREDIDLLTDYMGDDWYSASLSMADLLDDLFTAKVGASAPPSTPAASPAIERANVPSPPPFTLDQPPNRVVRSSPTDEEDVDFIFLEE